LGSDKGAYCEHWNHVDDLIRKVGYGS